MSQSITSIIFSFLWQLLFEDSQLEVSSIALESCMYVLVPVVYTQKMKKKAWKLKKKTKCGHCRCCNWKRHNRSNNWNNKRETYCIRCASETKCASWKRYSKQINWVILNTAFNAYQWLYLGGDTIALLYRMSVISAACKVS